MEREQVGSGGPYEDVVGYSRAVRVGAHVFVAGTCARDRELDAGADAGEQARAAWRIILDALDEVGAGPEDVVRTTTFLVDPDDWRAVGEAHREAVGDARPAATMVTVAALADPRMRVEIQVDAVVADPEA